MYQQQPQSLPVRADMPDTSAFVQGVPYSVPFVPQIQVRPQQQQLLHLITGYSIHALQASAQKNPQRCFLFNMMSSGRWQNQQFAEFVKTVGDYAEYLSCTGQIQNPEQAINQAATQLATIMTAVYTQQFPALQQGMTQQQWGDVQQSSQLFNQISNAVRQYQAQGQMGGFQQQPAHTQWQATHQSGGHQWTGGPAAAPMNMGVPPVSNWNHGVASAPAFAAPNVGGRQFRSSLRSTEVTPQQNDNIDSVSFGASGVSVREVVPAANFNTPQVQTVTTPNTVADQPAVGADGTEIRLAAKSGWNKTFDPSVPYSIAFNPRTHYLQHIRHPNGTVAELINEKAADMRYEDHELNPIFKLKARDQELSNGPRIDPAWEILPRLEAAPTQPIQIEGEEAGLKELDAPIYLAETIQAHSLEEAGLKARLVLLERDIKLADGAVFEYYVDHLIPTLTNGGSLVGVFNGLLVQKTVTELAERLDDLAKAGMPPEIWHLANDRLTECLNDMLEYNIGLNGWKIENFTGDTPELIKIIQGKYGDALIETINSHTGYLAEVALSCLRGDRLTAYIESLAGDVEISGEENPYEGLFVLNEKISVTHVPWLGSQIEIAMKAKAGAVMESYLPELYRAIKAVVQRVNDRESLDSQAFRYIYIVTADNVKIRIHVGFMGKGFYLISIE